MIRSRPGVEVTRVADGVDEPLGETGAEGVLGIDAVGRSHIMLRPPVPSPSFRLVGVPEGCFRVPEISAPERPRAFPLRITGLDDLAPPDEGVERLLEIHAGRRADAYGLPRAAFDEPLMVCDASEPCFLDLPRMTTVSHVALSVVDVTPTGLRTLVGTSTLRPRGHAGFWIRAVLEQRTLGAPEGAHDALVGVAEAGFVAFFGPVGSLTQLPVLRSAGEPWVAWRSAPTRSGRTASLLRDPYPDAAAPALPQRTESGLAATEESSLAYVARTDDLVLERGWVFEGATSAVPLAGETSTMDVAVVAGQTNVGGPVVGAARLELSP